MKLTVLLCISFLCTLGTTYGQETPLVPTLSDGSSSLPVDGTMPSTFLGNGVDTLNAFLQSILGQVLRPFALATGLDALNLNTVPDWMSWTPCQFIEAFDYACEEYNVVTKDHYNLNLVRIKGTNGTSANPRPVPVLLSHGILTSSRDWTINGKPHSIAFELADNNVDTWMVSHRGSNLSNTNTEWTTEDARFYNFSFHEIGIYDMPDTIEFILNKTNKEQLVHVGFSQGGTGFYVMMSELPEFTNRTVKTSIGLSPGSHACHSNNLLTAALSLINSNYELTAFFDYTGHENLLALTAAIFANFGAICYNIRDTVPTVCPLLFSLLVDFNNHFLEDRRMLPYIVYKSLKVTSTKQITHLTQNAVECGFYKYRPSPSEPPVKYDLNHPISTDLHVFGSINDHFVPPESIYLLEQAVYPNKLNLYMMDMYCHINMVFSMGQHAGYRQKFFDLILDATA